MKIEDAIKIGQKNAKSLSSSIIAERCEKCPEHPYGIKPAGSISPDEVITLVLSGIPEKHESTRAYNGFLKRVDNFVKSLNLNVRTVIAATDEGDYYDAETARMMMSEQLTNPKNAEKVLSQYPITTQKELLSPNYVNNIFEQVFLPRISEKNGTIRLPLVKALRRIRKVNIVAYCHGGHTALKLEELMQKKMAELGYEASERRAIQKQLMVLAYSPDCPLDKSSSRYIAISSASDRTINHHNAFKEYVNYALGAVLDFKWSYQSNNDNATFYCAKYNKYGVEGNPVKWVCTKINGIEDLIKPRPKDDSISEHDFLGYEDRPDMSKSAKRLQQIGKNILEASIKNSLEQKETGFKPLPKTSKLASRNLKDYLRIFQAFRRGCALDIIMNKRGRENIIKQSYLSNIQTITLD